MRSSQQGTERRERAKSANTVAVRMKQVVDKMIQSQKDQNPVAQITVFVYKSQQSEITYAFFQEIQREYPGLFRNREAFFGLVLDRYDEFTRALAN